MRSVKELGQSLRRRQGPHEVAGGAEEALLGAAGSTSSVVLVVAGCIAVCAGALLASVQAISPQHAWIVRNLGRMGIESGAVLAGGTALLGAGLVGKALAQAQRTILAALRRGSGVARVAEDLAQLREDLGKVHFALRVLQESTRSLVESSHEQALKRDAEQHGDAIYHLAGSVDQFRLRFEDLLVGQQSGLDRRFAELDANLREMRRRLSELTAQIESAPALSAHGAPQPRRSAEGAGDQAPQGAPRASSTGFSPSERIQPEPFPRTESGPRSEESEERDVVVADELDVLVTIEDAEELGGSASRKPRAAASQEPAFSPTSLGVLDILDDFGLEVEDDPDREEPEEREESDGERIDPASLFDDELGREIESELEARLSKMEHVETPSIDARAAEAEDTGEKLVQLRALLSDSRLRRALESMQASDAGLGSGPGAPGGPGAERAGTS